MTKSELRKIYLERRSSLSKAEIAGKSRQIADLFFENFDLSEIKTLHCFIPIIKFNEIDTSLIYKKVWMDFPSVKIVAPRVKYIAYEIENIVFGPKTELVENEWGIREPVSSESVEAGEIDLVLLPLLCFDKLGHRVGYGKGFYDRLLSICRPDCLKIGLGCFAPEVEIGDTRAHDIKLDRCITPEHIFDFQMNKGA